MTSIDHLEGMTNARAETPAGGESTDIENSCGMPAPRITSYNQHSLAQSSRIWNDNVLPIQLEVKLGGHSFPLMTQKPDAIQTVETLTDAGTMLPGIQHTCVRPPRSRYEPQVCVMWSALRIDSNAIWLDRPCLPQWCSRRGTDPESQSLHGVKQ
jgi:hypothetical protein